MYHIKAHLFLFVKWFSYHQISSRAWGNEGIDFVTRQSYLALHTWRSFLAIKSCHSLQIQKHGCWIRMESNGTQTSADDPRYSLGSPFVENLREVYFFSSWLTTSAMAPRNTMQIPWASLDYAPTTWLGPWLFSLSASGWRSFVCDLKPQVPPSLVTLPPSLAISTVTSICNRLSRQLDI